MTTREPSDPDVRQPVARRDPLATEPVAADPIVADPPAGGPVAGEPVTGWRAEVAGASGLNLLAGVWLIVSPWVLDYDAGAAFWNTVVSGALVAGFAFLRVSGAHRQSWMSWINAAIGVWLFVSAFLLPDSGAGVWNGLVLGGIVFILGAWSAFASEDGNAGEPTPTERG